MTACATLAILNVMMPRALGVIATVAFVSSRAAAEEAGVPAASEPKPEVVWANAEVGIHHVGLVTFADDGLTRPGNTIMKRSGPLYGTALGARVGSFTFGVRARYGASYAFDHWSLGAEAAFRPELGSFTPYAGLGVSYVQVDHLVVTSPAIAEELRFWEPRRIRGFGPRLLGGFDYRFAQVLSAGVAVSADLLFLRSNTISTLPSPTGTDGLVSPGGSSTGGGVAATAVLGLHI